MQDLLAIMIQLARYLRPSRHIYESRTSPRDWDRAQRSLATVVELLSAILQHADAYSLRHQLSQVFGQDATVSQSIRTLLEWYVLPSVESAEVSLTTEK